MPSPPGWGDRIRGWRDRVVSDPAFLRWASRFPLTRPIARRRSRALFDLCAGFVYSQVLAACVELNLFETLRAGSQPVEELARRLSLPVEGAGRLLAAAASLGLLERRGPDRYGLGLLGAAMLGNPGVAGMVAHHRLLYADLADPVALLRRGRGDALAGYWPYAEGQGQAALTEGDVAPYTALMSASQPLVSEEVLDAFPLRGVRRLLDVGAGDGAFLAAAGRRAPALELVGFDLPAVASLALARFEREGLSGRATAIGGSFLADPLPAGADLVSLVRIVHDHDDGPVATLLRAIRAAIAPGGTLLVAEPMAGSRGAEPIGDAYFGLYLLAMGSGLPRSPRRHGALLQEAGFERIRHVPTRNPLLASLVTARAPG